MRESEGQEKERRVNEASTESVIAAALTGCFNHPDSPSMLGPL